MSPVLDNNGLSIDDLATITTELEDAFKAAFGNDIDLSVESPFRQFVDIPAEREVLIQQLIESTYFSAFPDQADGTNLD